MCIEREKVDFKSREVNCLKECALALKLFFIINFVIFYVIIIFYCTSHDMI